MSISTQELANEASAESRKRRCSIPEAASRVIKRHGLGSHSGLLWKITSELGKRGKRSKKRTLKREPIPMKTTSQMGLSPKQMDLPGELLARWPKPSSETFLWHVEALRQ